MINTKMPDLGGFGLRLNRARTEKGLAARELADLSGVHMSVIYAYESGRSLPKLVNATYIAAALGVSLDWLIGRGPDD